MRTERDCSELTLDLSYGTSRWLHLDSIPLEEGSYSTLRILAQDSAGFGVPNVRLRLFPASNIYKLGRWTTCATGKALLNATGDPTDELVFETGVGGVAAVNITPSWRDCTFFDEESGRGALVLAVTAEEWNGQSLVNMSLPGFPGGAQPALVGTYVVRDRSPAHPSFRIRAPSRYYSNALSVPISFCLC